MNILLIEDDKSKKDELKDLIEGECTSSKASIKYASSLSDARRSILTDTFDLIVFDFYLPSTDTQDDVSDVSSDLISEFSNSRNYNAETIAITKYDLSSIDNIDLFNSNGVTVVHYSEDLIEWKESLKQKIKKISDKAQYDFLIFCALTKERSAYNKADVNVGPIKKIKGLNCQEININNNIGLCICPQRMGLVNMAIIASKAIDYFQPKIVAMSGICAGIPGEANILDVIVADMVWDYETGKITDDGFKQEQYQVHLDHQLKVDVQQLIEDESILGNIKGELYLSELAESRIILGPVVSGSAVVASSARIEKISEQHRKMVGLEMEMCALYEAAEQSLCKPVCIGAKSVVDLGDSKKGDEYHSAGCILSARLIAKVINKYLISL